MSDWLKAVIFDWAGTMIDYGSRAPVIALQTLFESEGVPITEAEARADMGRAKRDHIGALLAIPRVASAWADAKGAPPSHADGDALFAAIGPVMRQAARDCAILIPGAADVAQELQRQGVKIGSCTGYSREMMADILPLAREQGYAPDYLVCAGETPAGRPSPLMVWKNLVKLGVWPVETCVKVDDTEVGIAEGRAAGVWTVGVVRSGNIVGLAEAQLAERPPEVAAALLESARESLIAAGAHVVIDTVADLPRTLDRFATEWAKSAESSV